MDWEYEYAQAGLIFAAGGTRPALTRRVDVEQDQQPPVPADLIAHVNQEPTGVKAVRDMHAAKEAEWRKQRPLARGVLDYFPDALMEVAHTSWVGSQQHSPGEEMRWAKEKSTDEADCILRHLKDRGTRDTDGERHSAKVAWRALAMLQREIDAEKN